MSEIIAYFEVNYILGERIGVELLGLAILCGVWLLILRSQLNCLANLSLLIVGLSLSAWVIGNVIVGWGQLVSVWDQYEQQREAGEWVRDWGWILPVGIIIFIGVVSMQSKNKSQRKKVDINEPVELFQNHFTVAEGGPELRSGTASKPVQPQASQKKTNDRSQAGEQKMIIQQPTNLLPINLEQLDREDAERIVAEAEKLGLQISLNSVLYQGTANEINNTVLKKAALIEELVKNLELKDQGLAQDYKEAAFIKLVDQQLRLDEEYANLVSRLLTQQMLDRPPPPPPSPPQVVHEGPSFDTILLVIGWIFIFGTCMGVLSIVRSCGG